MERPPLVRQLRVLVRHLPRVGVLRLYQPADRPFLLPGERLVVDVTEQGLPRVAASWIVEPVPGRAAEVKRRYWHAVGRWVWALRHLNGQCECLVDVRADCDVRTPVPADRWVM